MNKVLFLNINGLNIIMFGLINFLENFDLIKIYLVIVVLYLGGGVKE